MAMAAKEKPGIQVIEFHMMDKRKYFPLNLVTAFVIRSGLYPFSVIKTRLQVQKHNTVYKGTFDAFMKIGKTEGARGLFKGYWVTNMLIVPQISYITTYEGVRYTLDVNDIVTNNKGKSVIAGFCASLVGQTFMVPVDIVSQHLMMMDTALIEKAKRAKRTHFGPLLIPTESLRSPIGRAKAVTVAVYKQDGIKGFYKGYWASLALYAPNSAMWWFFYDVYCGVLSGVAPDWMPRLMLQTMAAPLGGMTTSLITNPLDTVRARIQVEGTKFVPTIKNLWAEEKLGIFVKGLSARLIQSTTFSVFIILGYETIKRICILPEYKDAVQW